MELPTSNSVLPILEKMPAMSKQLARILGLGCLFYLAIALYAAIHWHGLYSDGASRLLKIISTNSLIHVHPSRAISQILMALPTVWALRSGLANNLPALSFVFGLSLLLWPLAFTFIAARLVPAEHAAYRLFPWLAFFAGTLMASFASIAEAAISTAIFWVLLMATIFRTATSIQLGVLMVATLPAFFLHEIYVFLAPILAGAAFLRWRNGAALPHRGGFVLLGCLFMMIAVWQLHQVINPVSVTNRESFLSGLMRAGWLHEGSAFNMPVILGTGAIGLGALAWLSHTRPALSRFAPGGVLQFGVMACLAILGLGLPLLGVDYVSPATQFAARNHPAFVAALLALAMLACWRLCQPQATLRTWVSPAVLSLLIIGSVGWHAVVQVRWASYIESYQRLLTGRDGLLSWEEAVRKAPPKDRAALWTFTWGWPNPAMSILLAPEGKVGTIIDDWSTPPKRTIFNPEAPETLLRARFWDLTPYIDAMRARGAP